MAMAEVVQGHHDTRHERQQPQLYSVRNHNNNINNMPAESAFSIPASSMEELRRYDDPVNFVSTPGRVAGDEFRMSGSATMNGKLLEATRLSLSLKNFVCFIVSATEARDMM